MRLLVTATAVSRLRLAAPGRRRATARTPRSLSADNREISVLSARRKLYDAVSTVRRSTSSAPQWAPGRHAGTLIPFVRGAYVVSVITSGEDRARSPGTYPRLSHGRVGGRGAGAAAPGAGRGARALPPHTSTSTTHGHRHCRPLPHQCHTALAARWLRLLYYLILYRARARARVSTGRGYGTGTAQGTGRGPSTAHSENPARSAVWRTLPRPLRRGLPPGRGAPPPGREPFAARSARRPARRPPPAATRRAVLLGCARFLSAWFLRQL
ncbi:hypothetical protein EVAR_32496_1 [Eumeta japonica]|uniref:Uncharacterized protein n=1 Tax=Eumeta variegata TaxID=151549 RepID=A0A4C1WA02_EUMVA|nr:hypothetical protein EVAR_32496_1 [Eumeta japonica]